MSAPAWAVAYLAAGFALVRIPRGSKGPVSPGWQTEENAIRTEAAASDLDGSNVGLAHRWSGTCAADIDDYLAAGTWLTARGIDVSELLLHPDAVQISSGRANRAKLLYRLPADVVWLPTTMPWDSGIEFRCATRDGAGSVQDLLPPSIHPETGKPYVWAGEGHYDSLPRLPVTLLALWRSASNTTRHHDHRSDDVYLDLLSARGLVAGTVAPGKTAIRCPFEAEHTQAWRGHGDTSTVYLWPLHSGLRWGRIYCAHAHCAERTQDQFIAALGGNPKTVWREQARRHREQVVVDEKAANEINCLPPIATLLASTEERGPGRIAPTCIVEGYLYADVALLVGPGSTGKTTLFLWECIHIILGRPLYGLEVVTPGPVLFVTAEDPRGILFARLWRMMDGMGLASDEIAQIYNRFHIWDVSGTVRQLAALDPAGNVALTWVADAVVDRFRGSSLVMVAFDPVISFGAGERLVNDNEQALILAARRIKNGLGGCCVRYIHHTGKESARECKLDQYAGRGGSALPDGARMVAVMQACKSEEAPVHLAAKEVDQVYALALPKVAYAPPQSTIWLKREGYVFEFARDLPLDRTAEARSREDQVWRFLVNEIKENRLYSLTELEAADLMPRAKLRKAVSMLRVWGRVEERQRVKGESRGRGPQGYLCPITTPDICGGVLDMGTHTPPPNNPAAAYREREPGGVSLPYSLNSAGEPTAGLAGLAGLAEKG